MRDDGGKGSKIAWHHLWMTPYQYTFPQKYNLGYTLEASNPEDAIQIFLEREFPQVLNWDKEPHDAFIIPDSFIYGIAHKVFSIQIFFTKDNFFQSPRYPSFWIKTKAFVYYKKAYD